MASSTTSPDVALSSLGLAQTGGLRPPVIFIGLPMAITVRDVLRTRVFPALVEAGAELHLFTPAGQAEQFRREFSAPRVHFHALRRPPRGPFDAVDRALLRMQTLILSLRCRTAEIMTASSLSRRPLMRVLRRALGTSPALQDALLGLARWVYRRVGPDLYREEFVGHPPDLVIGTRPLTMTDPRSATADRYLDRHLLVAAARRRVPTMVLVSSWDNLTTSGFFPVTPDCVTVWNEVMRDQAIRIHGVPPERVRVTGAPQHDVYAHGAFTRRDEFLSGLRLDSRRPVIVYATGTEGTIPDEHLLVTRLAERIRLDLPGAQLLVRLHQLDRRERYAGLEGQGDVVVDQAGHAAVGGYPDRDFDRAELERLADTLRHADVVVNFASSIAIDAAAVGTPVVMADFDARPGLPYHASGRRFYDFTHMSSLMECGGVARAGSEDELIRGLRAYLADRERDASGRRVLIERQCHRLDGRAGERVAEAVLAQVGVPVRAAR